MELGIDTELGARLGKSNARRPMSRDNEWTSRETYDYAIKKAVGYPTDEERVAVALFYSVFTGPGNYYEAMDEKGKEKMRWCARAAIAALAGLQGTASSSPKPTLGDPALPPPTIEPSGLMLLLPGA